MKEHLDSADDSDAIIAPRRSLPDWNVVSTVRDKHFIKACEVLAEFGPTKRTGYINVIVTRVADIRQCMDTLRDWYGCYPELPEVFGRVVPAQQTIDFATASEFEEKAKAVAIGWIAQLAGKSFHVRMHRRGGKTLIPSHKEEQLLADAIIGALQTDGTAGRIEFGDPDFILAIETVGNRAGLSLWSRDELHRYPFLRID